MDNGYYLFGRWLDLVEVLYCSKDQHAIPQFIHHISFHFLLLEINLDYWFQNQNVIVCFLSAKSLVKMECLSIHFFLAISENLMSESQNWYSFIFFLVLSRIGTYQDGVCLALE